MKTTNKAKATQGASKASKTNKKNTFETSEYFKKVILPNRVLKQQTEKIGYSIKLLLQNAEAIQLEAEFIKLLNKANKDETIYKQFAENVKKSKAGKYSPFKVLQYLYKIA